MEPAQNPFASPVASTDETKQSLLLLFRPTIFAFLVNVPFFIFSVIVVAVAVTGLVQEFLSFQSRAYCFLIAATAAIAGYGCATVFWCKVAATEHSLIRHDFRRHVIPFQEIESWWLQPFPNMVFVQVRGKRKPLPVNNWAMSRSRKSAIAEVLRERVGPPKKN